MAANPTATTALLAPTDRLATATTDLEPDSALAIRSAFETMFAQAEEWAARAKAINVTSVDQKREMKLARESRLALRDIRIKAEHARKRLKEDSTRRGKAIDGIANILKALIEPLEEHLLEQETFADRIEEARRDALREARAEALRAYGADPGVYANLGATSDETWELTLDAAKRSHEARLEAAKQAEAVRIEAERIAAERREALRKASALAEAVRADRERLQVETNARLAREAAEREEVFRLERARLAAEKSAEVAAAKADADRAAAELAAERAAARDREAAEATRLAAVDAARVAADVAPDRDKLTAFAATLRALTIPTMATGRGREAASKVAEQVAKMAGWVEKTGGAL